MSLSEVTSTSVCNISVGYSNEGIYFTTTETDVVVIGASNTEEARHVFTGTYRKKRSSFSTSEAIKSQLRFVHKSVHDKNVVEIQLIHLDI